MLQLKVLGGLSVHRDGRALSGALAQPRRLAILALLARGGKAGVPRDRLISTLWPDIEEERARHTLNQTLYAKVNFDPTKDLVGISLIAKVPLVFLATPESGITSMKDLAAQAKARPGKLVYASAGIGGTQHLAAEMFKSMAGVDVTHVPYKGSGPAQADFLGNQVPLMVDSVTSALPHIQSKKAVPLAVTSATRSKLLPDVPTVAESGVAGTNGFEAVGWLGLMAPRGTPPAVIERLQKDVNDILRTEAMVRMFSERGSEAAPTTGPEFDAFVASEVRKWGQIVKATGAKAE